MMWSARACLARSLSDRRFPVSIGGVRDVRSMTRLRERAHHRTSNVGDAENPKGASLDDATLVGEQRSGSGGQMRMAGRAAVGHVALVRVERGVALLVLVVGSQSDVRILEVGRLVCAAESRAEVG